MSNLINFRAHDFRGINDGKKCNFLHPFKQKSRSLCDQFEKFSGYAYNKKYAKLLVFVSNFQLL